ncbi:hypothetical protein B0J13DRAFT_640278 [Dactylonectria estremocensis]|uniref:CBM-cenC domain-containing protein n=1 Tax=Dactylonectria estremocensis TaxID=1079267 RepID=A0A9P9EFZ8_9HYPO|nr:hypothetical protein B0J13DRAFT_640278 [Dactylonectria estremocensis]
MFSSLKALTTLGLLALGTAAAPIEVGPENVVLSLNFGDSNMDNWYMLNDGCEFFADVVNARWANDVVDTCLRIGEISGTVGTGQSILKYKPSFNLELGETYQLEFTARSTFIGTDGVAGKGFGDNFGDFLQFAVFNAGGNIFSAWPGKGLNVAPEWYKWHWQFTVASGQDGRAYFGLIAHPSGRPIDWYLDDVSIIKVPK